MFSRRRGKGQDWWQRKTLNTIRSRLDCRPPPPEGFHLSMASADPAGCTLKKIDARRTKIGSVDWWTMRSEMEPAADTAAGLFAWPATAAQVLMLGGHQGCRAQLEEHLCNGVHLHSMYSGRGTAEAALMKLWAATDSLSSRPIRTREWTCGIAVERKPVAQRILLHSDGPSRVTHLFGDFDTLLADDMKLQIDKMIPRAQQSKSEKEAAFAEIGTYLNCHSHTAFPKGHGAYCMVHNTICCPHVIPGRQEKPFGVGSGSGYGSNDGVGEEFDCRHLVMWVAGSTCKDFSRINHKKMCSAGEHMRPWKVFDALVRKHRPHLLLHEITPSMVSRVLILIDIGDLYDVEFGSLSPVDVGWSCERERQIAVCTLRGSVVYTGSWEHVFRLFARMVMVSPSDIVECPQEYTDTVRKDKAAAHGHHGRHVGDHTITAEQLLSPCQLVHHGGYQELGPACCSLAGEYWFDLDQSPLWGRCSPFFPTLLSHGTLMNGLTGQILGGMQHLALMGDALWPAQQAGHKFGCDYAALILDGALSEGQMKDIAGSALHEAVFGFVQLYVPAHTKRVSGAHLLATAIGDHSIDAGDEEDEDDSDTTL